jgi:hypothetical protein
MTKGRAQLVAFLRPSTTLAELAEKCRRAGASGTTRAALCKLRNGTTAEPGLRLALALKGVCGIDPAWWLEEADHKFPQRNTTDGTDRGQEVHMEPRSPKKSPTFTGDKGEQQSENPMQKRLNEPTGTMVPREGTPANPYQRIYEDAFNRQSEPFYKIPEPGGGE